MVALKKFFYYFSMFEKILWAFSVALISLSFFVFDGKNYLTYIASLIGITSLIFIAKGNPIGQILIIIFGSVYGYISYSCAYYGEMITYMGMTVPMAVAILINWLRNPFKGKRAEVTVGSVTKKQVVFILALTLMVTVGFHFILKLLGTANLFISTVSISTSFFAVCLTYKRSPFFSLAYVFNDVVLITLWSIESASNSAYICVVMCFLVFLVNDSYSFYNWQKMRKRQAQ